MSDEILYEIRSVPKEIFNYIKDDLFITNYSKNLSIQLHNNAIENLSELDIINTDFII